MSVALNNATIKGELAITKADDTKINETFADGFYVGSSGTVTFSYKSYPSVKHVKTFSAGDTWFGDIFSIDATGTTAGLINGLRLDK